MYPFVKNMIVAQITKRIEMIMSIQVCLISRMDFDYEEWKEKLFLQIQSFNTVYTNMKNMIVVH